MSLKHLILYPILFGLSLFLIAGCATTQNNGASENREAKTFDSEEYYAGLLSCVEQIRERTDFEPDVALVLGSGLGDYAEKLDVVETIPYSEIDGWPQTSVAGHPGNLIFATMDGLNIAVMQGRVHYYEGYDAHEVVLPLRVLHLLGAKTVILTNAVGAINKEYSIGDFMVVEDHIASFIPSPLRGENIEELGTRFPGMADAYDEELRDAVLEIGKKENITVHQGVFVQSAGPQYETPAEIKAYGIMGADTVGMSSAIEATAAVHMGMRVCMINCVTNMAAGIVEEESTHEDVRAGAEALSEDFSTLITSLLRSVNGDGSH